VDCTTLTGDDVVSPNSSVCYRILGETSGATVFLDELYCSGIGIRIPGYQFGTCASDDECQAYADDSGLSAVRGVCVDQQVNCYGPSQCKPNPFQSGCAFFYTADSTCGGGSDG
jgi:hypothetical protein